MQANIKDLPGYVKAALKDAGFKGSKVEVKVVADCLIDLHHYCCFDYNRGFSLIINLATGESKALFGNFGGMAYCPTIVDNTEGQKFLMPPGCMVIKGEVGYSCFATVYLRPDNVVPGMLGAPCIDARMYRVLMMHAGKGIEKAARVASVTAEERADAIAAGLLVKKGRGYSVTVNGDNAMEKFVKENPEKRMGWGC